MYLDSLHIENLQHLTNQLPDQTYIIAFQGFNIHWKTPNKITNSNIFNKIKSLF